MSRVTADRWFRVVAWLTAKSILILLTGDYIATNKMKAGILIL